MSLEFNRYPHLVSKIEVLPVDKHLPRLIEDRERAKALLEMNDDTSTAWMFLSYFRYRHPHPESNFEGTITGDDEHSDLTTVEFWVPRIGAVAYMGDVALKSTHDGSYLVNPRYDFTATTQESKQNVRLAVAGAFGYEPGLAYLATEDRIFT